MDLDGLLRLIVFAVAGFITPGPNTMMVLASGVNFGFQRTVPHILGIMSGTILLFWAVGFGLHALLGLYPSMKVIIQILGVFYLLYLAYKIALQPALHERASVQPLTCSEAVVLQAVNVKLMGVAASVSVTYPIFSDPNFSVLNVLVVGLIAGLVNGPCVSAWGVFGLVMRRVLAEPVALRLFNLVLAALILLTLIPVIADVFVSLKGL